MKALRCFLAVALIFGISFSIVSAALAMGNAPRKAGAQTNFDGMLLEWGIMVNFVDANANDQIDSLVDDQGSTIHTFSPEIARPASDTIVEIEGEATIYGASTILPPSFVHAF